MRYAQSRLIGTEQAHIGNVFGGDGTATQLDDQFAVSAEGASSGPVTVVAMIADDGHVGALCGGIEHDDAKL
jgi:hypothetical protein